MDQTPPQLKDYSRIVVVGNVDSGKSTLVGVLTRGTLDDGNGSARAIVLNSKHEQQNGRTSSISHQIIGFDSEYNQMLPAHDHKQKNTFWADVVRKSSKIVTVLDLCGHEKYLKTTLFGLVSMSPDYSMIVIGANAGLSKMTREHFGISLFLKIPMILVITKIDLAPSEILENTKNDIKKLSKIQSINKTAIFIDHKTPSDQIDRWVQLANTNTILPVFMVSNKTGEGVAQLRTFLGKIPNRTAINNFFEKKENPFQYDIHEQFSIKGIGMVVSGIIRSGQAKVNQVVQLGPDKNKQFKQVVIKSIQVNRVNVDESSVGQLTCFNIKPLNNNVQLEKNDIRKGMVLLDPQTKPEVYRHFEANVFVIHNPSLMSIGSSSVMHSASIRQAAAIEKLTTKEYLRSNDQDLVRFRFLYHSEFLKVGQIIALREGRSKVFGTITRLVKDHEIELEKSIEK